MKKNTIKLNEEQLKKLVADSVKKALMEGIMEHDNNSVAETMTEAFKATIAAWNKLGDLIDEAKNDNTMKYGERLLRIDDLFKELVDLLNIW